MKGEIKIILEGISFIETERCRRIIHKLFDLGFFNIKNGSFTMRFDADGSPAAWEKTITGRNDKPSDSFKSLGSGMEQFVVELSGPEKTTIAKKV